MPQTRQENADTFWRKPNRDCKHRHRSGGGFFVAHGIAWRATADQPRSLNAPTTWMYGLGPIAQQIDPSTHFSVIFLCQP